MAEDVYDLQSTRLKEIVTYLEPTERYEHRTAVILKACIKCLNERSWLEIRKGKLRSEICEQISEARTTEDYLVQRSLLIEVLAKAKVLGQTHLLSNELHHRASEFLLQGSTFILSHLSTYAENGNPPSDSILAEQIVMLNKAVGSINSTVYSLFDTVDSYAAYTSQGDSIEEQVQRKALAGIIAFGNEIANRAQALADIASNSLQQVGEVSPAKALARKQWAIAYAVAAATISGACKAMIHDSLLAYGNNPTPESSSFSQYLETMFTRR